MLQGLGPDYDADSESILPLFEDRLGYGIEEEDYEESPVKIKGGSGNEDPSDNG